MDFDKKYITIFNFILEVIIHNSEIFYEQYGEDFIEKFEIKYREKFKHIALNKIKQGDLKEVLFKYFQFDEQQDEYGLQGVESDLKFELEEICRELCSEIDLETRIIKNHMESCELNKLIEEKKVMEKLNSELKIKNKELNMSVNSLKNEKEQKVNEINRLKFEIYEKKELNNQTIKIDKEKESLKINILKLTEENIAKEKNIKHLKQIIEIFKNKEEGKVNEINQNYENQLKPIKENCENLKIQIQKYENEIDGLNSVICEKNEENKKLKIDIKKLNEQNMILKNKKVRIINQEDLIQIVEKYRHINKNIIDKISDYYRTEKIIKNQEDYEKIYSKFRSNIRDVICSKQRKLNQEKISNQEELKSIQKEVSKNIIYIRSLIEEANKIHDANDINYRFEQEIEDIKKIQNQL